MKHEHPTATEIDRRLREEFTHGLRELGHTADGVDPILAIVFRTLGSQIEQLYSETDRIRLGLLDELIRSLGLESRMARPAQTIVRFHAGREPVLVEAGTELLGEAESGERLEFMTDCSILASSARIAFAAGYSGGWLRLLSGVGMSDAAVASRPSREAVRVNGGPAPALYIAIENLPQQHLSHHGLFFEIRRHAEHLQRALTAETWCLARPDGCFSAEGLLRPVRANAGHRALEWLLAAGSDNKRDAGHEMPALPDGFYAGRAFVFPAVPPDRRFTCSAPRGMEAAVAGLFGDPRFVDEKRAWIRIGLPSTVTDLEEAVAGLLLHAAGASNLEYWNQTVSFERHGTSVPVSREAGTAQFLVAPVSITGENGAAYISDTTPSGERGVGRYSFANGMLRLKPARQADRHDRYANVRLWLTHGDEGNTVAPGQVHSFLRRTSELSVQVTNPAASAGGSDGESYADAHARFSRALLSRDRIVTRADVIGAVRAFDRRIVSPELKMMLRRTDHGLQRTHVVAAGIRRHDLTDPARERSILQEELTADLQSRSLFDEPIEVHLEVLE